MTTSKQFSLSVKVVVRDRSGRCLLLKRSMRSLSNPGKWEFPGGKLDPGEGFEEALIRETAEETGLRIALRRVAGAAESEMPDARVAYLIMEASAEPSDVRLSDEHDDHAWVTMSELPEMDLAEQFRRFAAEYSRNAGDVRSD